MKSFKDMTYLELVEEREVAEEIKQNSIKDSDNYVRACLKIDAINSEIDRRKHGGINGKTKRLDRE